eukprot:gene13656-13779_t
MRGVITICNTCILTFQHIVLANDNPEVGPSTVFVTGEAPSNSSWALVRSVDTVRKRVSCLPSELSVAYVKKSGTTAYFDSPALADVTPAAFVQDFSFRGRLFPDSLHINGSGYRIARTYVHIWKQYAGGLDMLIFNHTRICDAYVEQSCLKDKTEDVCLRELAEALIARASQQQSKPNPVAIALPVALGSMVLLAVVVLLWRRRRLAQQQRGRLLGSWTGSSYQSDPERLVSGQTVVSKGLLAHPGSAPAHLTSCTSSSGGSWRILHSYSCNPALGEAAAATMCKKQLTSDMAASAQMSEIQLGKLLGAGSFGRVYKGIWRGKDVAVKVIDHQDNHETSGVFREAQLLLSLKHQNIVKAYSFFTCTWVGNSVQSPGPVPGSATSDAAASSSTPPTDQQLVLPQHRSGDNPAIADSSLIARFRTPSALNSAGFNPSATIGSTSWPTDGQLSDTTAAAASVSPQGDQSAAIDLVPLPQGWSLHQSATRNSTSLGAASV